MKKEKIFQEEKKVMKKKIIAALFKKGLSNTLFKKSPPVR